MGWDFSLRLHANMGMGVEQTNTVYEPAAGFEPKSETRTVGLGNGGATAFFFHHPSWAHFRLGARLDGEVRLHREADQNIWRYNPLAGGTIDFTRLAFFLGGIRYRKGPHWRWWIRGEAAYKLTNHVMLTFTAARGRRDIWATQVYRFETESRQNGEITGATLTHIPYSWEGQEKYLFEFAAGAALFGDFF